jgi:hypothetical protein
VLWAIVLWKLNLKQSVQITLQTFDGRVTLAEEVDDIVVQVLQCGVIQYPTHRLALHVAANLLQ